MIIKNTKYGTVEVTIYVDRFSSVDSYIESGYSEDRDLTAEELDTLQNDYEDIIQEYSYANGSLNHN